MNAHTNIDTMISDALREVAMIAEIKTTALGLTRTDKQASAKTTQAHHAVSNAARVSVNRLAGNDDKHRVLTGLQEAIRLNLVAWTTAWGSTGRRLMPNVNFDPWIREHARLQGEFTKPMTSYKADCAVHRAACHAGARRLQHRASHCGGDLRRLLGQVQPRTDPQRHAVRQAAAGCGAVP